MEILQKLKQLEENITLLQELQREIDLEKLRANKRLEWELRYGLFESIQLMIDISCKIVNHYNLGKPKNYRECIELLAKFGYIQRDLVSRYKAMVGLRNLLVHEYATIDREKLFSFLDYLDDFIFFIQMIQKALG